MKLLTKEILALLPAIGANAEKSAEETLVPLKLFNPGGAGSWFITELEPVNKDEAFDNMVASKEWAASIMDACQSIGDGKTTVSFPPSEV